MNNHFSSPPLPTPPLLLSSPPQCDPVPLSAGRCPCLPGSAMVPPPTPTGRLLLQQWFQTRSVPTPSDPSPLPVIRPYSRGLHDLASYSMYNTISAAFRSRVKSTRAVVENPPSEPSSTKTDEDMATSSAASHTSCTLELNQSRSDSYGVVSSVWGGGWDCRDCSAWFLCDRT